ncbi:U-scoloptoxin(16)-Ssd1a [Anopheles moucheti]|uniref:U-scoloptoxin(16)-Ssd1a n=1 Tax=Anopheles moucheti TaxID=186751 RepID=UPI0022F051ED|nr:U-scoloptoxin(16)-Ssd1a [Anopheles moucheti]
MNPAINRLVLVACVVLVCLAAVSQAYVYIIPNAKSPDQEGHCYDETLKISVPVNEVRQRPNRCESMSCGIDYALHVAGCGVISAGPGMTITKTNYSKPYPDCCPHLAMSAENVV